MLTTIKSMSASERELVWDEFLSKLSRISLVQFRANELDAHDLFVAGHTTVEDVCEKYGLVVGS